MKRTPYTLVVIDMQREFEASLQKRVQKHCIKEITEAKSRGYAIILVEYVGYGHTLPKLFKIVDDYHRAFISRKCRDDGSDGVSNLIKSNHLHSNLRICGVNTDACVLSTVRGLTKKMKRAKIHVVANACGTGWGNHQGGLDDMKNYKNVVIT
jgi:nicotinamidase-related amidase